MKNIKKIMVLFFMTTLLVIQSINLNLSNGTYVAQAASVSINKSSLSLIVGNSYTLKLKGTSKNGKWSSANKKIAVVDSKGKVTALKAGKTEIYVQLNNQKFTCKLTVKDPVLNYKSVSLDVDQTVKLQLEGVKGEIKWQSEDSSIASVDRNGEVTAIAPGKAYITASVGNSTYLCKVTVNDIEVEGFYINQQEYYLYQGETTKIAVEVYPANATIKSITYKSSDENIAKVDKDGMITAMKLGTVTIYATCNNITDALTIEVIPKPTLSVRNTTLQLGEAKEAIINKLGQPSSIAKSNYGDETYAYVDDYSRLLFVYMKDKKAVGYYTNSIDFDFSGINKQSTGSQSNIRCDKYYCRFFVDSIGDNCVNGLLLIDNSVGLNDYTDEILSNMEKEVFHITNSYRVQRGLSQLIWSDAANVSAKKHSYDMAINHYFSHTSLSGTSPADRMVREGITYSYAGENIAVGQPTSLEVCQAWFQSEGHRKNMLYDYYTYLGVGIATEGGYGLYYTQNFYAQR